MVNISIIVPTFNRSNMLKESLNSILNQTYTDFEILDTGIYRINISFDGVDEKIIST